jgi:hypothetical protein
MVTINRIEKERKLLSYELSRLSLPWLPSRISSSLEETRTT